MQKKKEISDNILNVNIGKKRVKEELKNKERIKSQGNKNQKEKQHTKKANGRYTNGYNYFVIY